MVFGRKNEYGGVGREVEEEEEEGKRDRWLTSGGGRVV